MIAKQVFISKSLPLSAPIIYGELLITRMRYPVPLVVAVSMVAVIGLLVEVPIIIGVVNEPLASDSCA